MYYQKLKGLWDEIDALEAPYMCTCNYVYANGRLNGARESRKRLLQFLMGLDECFSNVRGQILLMQPLPNATKAYAMMRQEEKQRETNTPKFLSPTVMLTFNNSRALNTQTAIPNTRQVRTNTILNNRRSTFKHGVIYGNCQKEGNYQSECYQLVGYPVGHPLHDKALDNMVLSQVNLVQVEDKLMVVAAQKHKHLTTIQGSISQQEKLTGPKFTNWYQNLRIVRRSKGKLAHLEQPLIHLSLLIAPQAVRDTYEAYDMIQELKTMFEEQAKHELFKTVKAFHAFKEEDGQSNYDQFVHNMHSMGRTIVELHAMLKLHEKGIPKKVETLVVLAIREAQDLPPPKRDNPAKDSVYHHCKEVGHWKRNCPSYQAELKKRKNASIASTIRGLRGSRKLKHGALSLYVGNGMRAAIEAIGSFDLVLPSGLIIRPCLAAQAPFDLVRTNLQSLDLSFEPLDYFTLSHGLPSWKSFDVTLFLLAVWMRKFIDGLGGVMPLNRRPIEMLCDNELAIAMANDLRILKGARHFQRKYHYICEVIQEREIVLKKVYTDDNVVDPFIKPMPFDKHYEHAMAIGIVPARSLT
ncbi:zinc finger, CCHC-type containing protein [Tanacetum coccineum]